MKHLKTLLVTANVGSLFDDPENLFPTWFKTFYQTLSEKDPDFIAIHCQEVGGKNFEDSMPNVHRWIEQLQTAPEMRNFTKSRIFLDEDYKSAPTFTALGSLYFIHSRVEKVKIWDFLKNDFIEIFDSKVYDGSIESVSEKDKQKFPKNYFPNQTWSRKGYLRTRWQIYNSLPFDLVNVHLFHDANNVESLIQAPSKFAKYRAAALIWILSQLSNHSEDVIAAVTNARDASDLVNNPTFVFGDFNFRLNLKQFAELTTANCNREDFHDAKGKLSKVEFKNDSHHNVVLRVGSKLFDRFDFAGEFFENKNNWLNDLDQEAKKFHNHLYEFPVTFPPTYPFSEEPNEPTDYMRTRLPSWCDRILCSHSTRKIVLCPPEQPTHYAVMGLNSAMGDHKPVYLFTLLSVVSHNGGDECLKSPPFPPIAVAAAATTGIDSEILPPPPLLQKLLLLDQPGVQVKLTEQDGAVYVHVRRDGATVCVFRETAV